MLEVNNMSYIKHIKFVYYRLFVSDLSNSQIFSLVELIGNIENYSLKKRILTINDDKYRLENI